MQSTPKDRKEKQEPTTGKNPIAQCLITAIEKTPHLTHEDIDALRQSIEEGKMPIKLPLGAKWRDRYG